jgi:hypothetical protein
LDKKEAEYIRQVNAKEIDKARFWELVSELDLERAMGESIAEGLAMTQDKEARESEQDESESAAVAVELLTIGKGKQKVAPTRAKVFSEIDGPVSDPAEVVINRQLTHMLTVQPMLHSEDEAKVHHHTIRAALQEVPI